MARLRAAAERQGRPMRDLVLDAVVRALEREAFRSRLAARAPVDLGLSAGSLLEALREEREDELSR